MSSYMSVELRLFITAVLFGAAFLLLYEVLLALRIVFSHEPLAVQAEDLLFWMTAGLEASVLIFKYSGGVLRGYLLLGAGLGAALAYLTAGAYVRQILAWILQKLLFFMNSLLTRLLFPIKRCKIMLYYFMRIGRYITKNAIHSIRGDSRSEKAKGEKEEQKNIE